MEETMTDVKHPIRIERSDGGQWVFMNPLATLSTAVSADGMVLIMDWHCLGSDGRPAIFRTQLPVEAGRRLRAELAGLGDGPGPAVRGRA
jgi:hypothetical protein